MISWPVNPLIYEISTWVWLRDLSVRYNTPVNLSTIPAEVWDSIAAMGFDAVWLMGVWERSPAGIAIANNNQGLTDSFKRALPDYRQEDNVGSPYCIRQYVVDARLGGNEGLAAARKELADRGMRLILDFVPNHVAPDHPWAGSNPEYFIQGSVEDARREPASFVAIGEKVFACGKDPFFPAWPDVLQLNVFKPELRQAVIGTLMDIAQRCDGVRCDMAMLVMNSIFERTWGQRAGQRPGLEYWVEIIPAIRKISPGFLFMAEAYWDLEWELQLQGFDYCYDKRLYDRLEHGNVDGVRQHLNAELAYQGKLLRFIENHDEPRALSAFTLEKSLAAAVLTATLPGARLFFEGQFEGQKTRLPVFLGRRPAEPVEPMLRDFYRILVGFASSDLLQKGSWRQISPTGWSDNQTCRNLIAWCWQNEAEMALLVINLSAGKAQGMVRLPGDGFNGRMLHVRDLFAGNEFEKNGDEMRDTGLYVDRPAWGIHVFTVNRK